MKYIKSFERVWTKNIKIGEVYKIGSQILAYYNWSSTIDFGEVVDISYRVDDPNLISYIDIKTYIKGSKEEHTMTYSEPDILIRKATKQEKLEFETFKEVDKYNL